MTNEITYVSSAIELRDAAEIGIREAKGIVRGVELRESVDRSETLEDLKPVLRELIDKLYPQMPNGFGYIKPWIKR